MIIPRVDSWLGKGVAALAVMLVILLVVQAPVAMADRLLHSTGQDHAPNLLAGAVFDLPDHDHDHDHADADQGLQVAQDDAPRDAAAPGSHHHHHDGPSVYGLTDGVGLPFAWSSSISAFQLRDNLRKGTSPRQPDHPPKTILVHVA